MADFVGERVRETGQEMRQPLLLLEFDVAEVRRVASKISYRRSLQNLDGRVQAADTNDYNRLSPIQ